MNDINFDITKHWLPVGEKQGSIEKDTLRIKVSGINFHTKPEANFEGTEKVLTFQIALSTD